MEDETKEQMTLANIKNGAAVEMFDWQLQRVFNNIGDINTSLKEREINLKVKLKPSKDRSLLAITIECTAKMAAQETQETTADLRLDERQKYFARERIPLQEQFSFKPQNVTPINKGDNGQ